MIKLKKAELEKELAEARGRNLELEQRLVIALKRAEHADTENAQAKVSRDSWKDKYLAVATVLKRHAVVIPNERTARNALARRRATVSEIPEHG